jgi:G:T/U-mismatch repair DNA glycosylase
VGGKNLDQKKRLFEELKIAIGDTILECEREKGSNLDTNLINISYNIEGIRRVLNENKIEKIFFSSRWVEKIYKSKFKKLVGEYGEIELVTLPCPSPRYFRLKLEEKAEIYKEVLPKVKV